MTITDHDDTIEQRVRTALDEIAEGYRSGSRRPEVENPRPPRWSRPTVTVATAVVVALAGVATWWVADTPWQQPPDRQVATTAPPGFGDDFSVPDVEPLPWAVQIDDSLDLGEFERRNRWDHWLQSNEPIESRWFVRVEEGQRTASIYIGDYRHWIPFGSGEPYEAHPELDAVIVDESNIVAWEHDGAIRTVNTSPGVRDYLDEVVAEVAAVDDVVELAVPEGFEEITYLPFTGFMSNDAGWSFSIADPAPGETELVLAAWFPEHDGEAIDGGWLGRATNFETGEPTDWRAFVQVEDFVVLVNAPGYVDDDVMRTIADRLQVVRLGMVRERPLEVPGTMSAGLQRAAPIAAGELSWGRWLAVEDTARGRDLDAHCLVFKGLVMNLEGCGEPGSDEVTICGALRTWNGQHRVVMVTTRPLPVERLPITADLGTILAETTIEESGGLTFAVAETNGNTGLLSFIDATGSELCER